MEQYQKFSDLGHINNFDSICSCFNNLCSLSIQAIKNGNKIIFYGNGGSASDSQHLAAELVVKYQKNRQAISSTALSSDNSMITATANDFHFKRIF